jgi:hypothetical protein
MEMDRVFTSNDYYIDPIYHDLAALHKVGGDLDHLLMPSPVLATESHVMVWVKGSKGDKLR